MIKLSKIKSLNAIDIPIEQETPSMETYKALLKNLHKNKTIIIQTYLPKTKTWLQLYASTNDSHILLYEVLTSIVTAILIFLVWISFWYYLQIVLPKKHLILKALSHDLKNPLARAILALDLVEGASKKEKEMVKQSLDEINEIINSSIAYAKPDDNINKKHIDVIPLIKKIIKYHKYDNFKIQFKSEVKECMLLLEPSLFRRMLQNIIDNAEKNSTKLIIKVTKDPQHNLIITFTDNGKGAADKIIKKLAKPYYQSSELNQGVGLGLAIVKKIADLHSASVKFSNDGETGFIVELKFTSNIKKIRQKKTPNKGRF